MNDTLSVIQQKLKSSEPSVREEALDQLGDINYPGAFDLIRSLVDDPSEAVRGTLACNLGSIGDDRSVPVLLRLAESDSSKEVRAEAVASLRTYHNSLILGFLLQHASVRGLTRRIRQEIAKQLGNYPTEEAAKALRALTEDEDAFVRDFALESLKRVEAALNPRLSNQPLDVVPLIFTDNSGTMEEVASGTLLKTARLPFVVLDYEVWSNPLALAEVTGYCRRQRLQILLPEVAFYELGKKTRDYELFCGLLRRLAQVSDLLVVSKPVGELMHAEIKSGEPARDIVDTAFTDYLLRVLSQLESEDDDLLRKLFDQVVTTADELKVQRERPEADRKVLTDLANQ